MNTQMIYTVHKLENVSTAEFWRRRSVIVSRVSAREC
jgi:hypothetical protein